MLDLYERRQAQNQDSTPGAAVPGGFALCWPGKVYSTLLEKWLLQGFPATFTFRLADVEPWGGQQTGVSIAITLIVFGPVLLFAFGRRAWYRYLCPIGALLKIFSGVSIGKVRLVNDECIGLARVAAFAICR